MFEPSLSLRFLHDGLEIPFRDQEAELSPYPSPLCPWFHSDHVIPEPVLNTFLFLQSDALERDEFVGCVVLFVEDLVLNHHMALCSPDRRDKTTLADVVRPLRRRGKLGLRELAITKFPF